MELTDGDVVGAGHGGKARASHVSFHMAGEEEIDVSTRDKECRWFGNEEEDNDTNNASGVWAAS